MGAKNTYGYFCILWCGKNGKRLKTCYKEGEAAHVLWDTVEATGEPAQQQLIEIKLAKWNGNEAGAWRFELGKMKMNYGIREWLWH